MVVITPVSAVAKSKEEINNEISALEQKTKELEKQIKVLKDQKADQNAIKKKIQQKVDNTKEQISLCNNCKLLGNMLYCISVYTRRRL